jgi:DNA invertase Pin-like site-specific DNA recombinase
MTDKAKALRFAPLIRVSTEKQEKQGESLRTQKTQITQYVKSLDGSIPASCWQYAGQEHATPNQERAKLDKLLADSGKGLFDAVIVCDASRWSRDNLKSKTGLEILRKNGIRFFGGTMEYDLFNPEHKFFLGVSAEIGELQARQQSLKSIINRIERAKRGIPTCGKQPFGRIFNKETGQWGLDPIKADKVKTAARLYLAGTNNRTISATVGLNWPFLWVTLNRGSGDQWQQRFHAPDLNIDETTVTTVPRLLDEATIKKIRQRAQLNKTNHREINTHYLLSKFIFCESCGYRLQGQLSHRRKRYYRHQEGRDKACKVVGYVPSDLMENAVLVALVRTFGDPERIRLAIEAAVPNKGKVEQLRAEQETLTKNLAGNSQQTARLVDAVASGALSNDAVKTKMEALEIQAGHLIGRHAEIEAELENVPGADQIKQLSKMAIAVFADAVEGKSKRQPIDQIVRKPWAWKRRLIEACLIGTDHAGKPLGVYVGRNKQGHYFEIRGILDQVLTSRIGEDLDAGEGSELADAKSVRPLPGTTPPGCRSP